MRINQVLISRCQCYLMCFSKKKIKRNKQMKCNGASAFFLTCLSLNVYIIYMCIIILCNIELINQICVY
jgi:hypothetical protein